MKTKTSLWFTLVELIVASSILIILISVGFYSYSQNLEDTRDSLRKTDIANLESQLKLYKQRRWAYPLPADRYNITNSWVIVALQWRLTEQVPLTTASYIPVDPLIEEPYIYSILNNRQEFEVSLSLENAGNPLAVLVWDYRSVSRNFLPSISLAIDNGSDTEINWGIWAGATNRLAFIFDNGGLNLPYSFDEPFDPIVGATTFEDAIDDPTIQYWQNSDYRNCTEIFQAGKSISNGIGAIQYQILNSSGALVNTDCDFL